MRSYLVVAAALVAVGLGAQQRHAHAHNNYLSFYSDEGSFVFVSYDISSDTITPGQPFNGISVQTRTR